MDEADDELLIAKPDVYLYEIPLGKVGSECDHRAADWDVAHPTWQGKILIYKAGPCCHVQLDDPQGDTYGQAVLEIYPGRTLKLVADSRRYFTLNVQNVQGDFRLVGVGFTNREDSSEINNILKGYFAAVGSRKRKLEKSYSEQSDASAPKKERSSLVEWIHSQTNDPDYKYIAKQWFRCSYCPNNKNFSCPKLIARHWFKIHELKDSCLCVCKLPFPSKGERQHHLKKFHPEVSFCGSCRNPCGTEQEMVEHLRQEHQLDVDGNPTEENNQEPIKFRCAYCNQDCISRFQLVRHFQNSHARQVKQTTSINKDGSEVEGISVNGEKHSSGSKFALFKTGNFDPNYPYASGNLLYCRECSETFEDIHGLSRHWKQVHNLVATYCDCSCKLPFPGVSKMRDYKEKFHPFSCFLCNNRFAYGSGLEEHLLNFHLSDHSGKKINSLDIIKFRCEHCEDWFFFKALLSQHVKSKHARPCESIPQMTCKTNEKEVVSKGERMKHNCVHTKATKTAEAVRAERNSTEVTDEDNDPTEVADKGQVSGIPDEEKQTTVKVEETLSEVTTEIVQQIILKKEKSDSLVT